MNQQNLTAKYLTSELSSQGLIRWTQPSEKIRIVEFYASWCIYHFLTKRKLQMLHEALGQDVFAGSIDSVGNEELFTELGVTQVPSIGFFRGSDRLVWVGDTDLEVMLEDIQNLSNTRTV